MIRQQYKQEHCKWLDDADSDRERAVADMQALIDGKVNEKELSREEHKHYQRSMHNFLQVKYFHYLKKKALKEWKYYRAMKRYQKR